MATKKATPAKKAASKSASRSSKTSSGSAKASGGSARAKRTASKSHAVERVLIDHYDIRQWAEERSARPSRVKGTGGRGEVGVIRLDFPGYTGEETLEQISWEEWLWKFDENNLALVVQDKTADGRISNFNKLVKRHAMEGRVRAAGGASSAGGGKTK